MKRDLEARSYAAWVVWCERKHLRSVAATFQGSPSAEMFDRAIAELVRLGAQDPRLA